MKVNFNTGSQDIMVRLERKEFEDLTKQLKEGFFEDCIKATSLEAQAHFFLGHAKGFKDLYPRSDKLDGGIELNLPEDLEDPYSINLLPETVQILKSRGEISSRYFGGPKLMIKVEELCTS